MSIEHHITQQVVNSGDNVEALKEEVMSDMADIFDSVDKGGASEASSIYGLRPHGWVYL